MTTKQNNIKVTYKKPYFEDFKDFDGTCPSSFLDTEARFKDRGLNEKIFYDKTMDKRGDSFLNQFTDLRFDNPKHPSASNNVSGNINAMKLLDDQRNLALAEGFTPYKKHQNMTYNVTKADEFEHINMVPFFSTKAGYGNYDKGLNYGKDWKVDLFTGTSRKREPKHEINALFAPQMNVHNVNGMPNLTHRMGGDRFHISDTRNGELLFEPTRVGPGLNIDYYAPSTEGYQPLFRPLGKTVDELRVANKKRISYTTPVKHSGMRGVNIPVQAPVAKNKPYAFFEIDPKNILKTFGYIVAPKMRENYCLGPTKRETTHVAYSGQPGTTYGDVANAKPDFMFAKVKVSNKAVFGNAGLRNVQGHKGNMRPNVQIGQNERSTTTLAERAGNILGELKGWIFNPKDVPKVTMKEQTLHETTPYTHISPDTQQALRTRPTDQARTTLREQMIHNEYVGAVDNNVRKGIAYNPKDIPKTTMRELILDNEHIGNIKGEFVSAARIKGDRMKTTKKELLIHESRAGKFISPGYQKTRYFDPNDKPDVTKMDMVVDNKRLGNIDPSFREGPVEVTDHQKTTRREQYLDNEHLGTIGNLESHNGYQTGEYEAPTTLRQLIIDAERAGHISGVQNTTGYISAKYTAPTTLKELIINKDRAGNIGSDERNGYVVAKYHAKDTARQATGNTYYRGPVNANDSKHSVYDQYYRMEIDGKKQHVASAGTFTKDRMPTTSNYEKTPQIIDNSVRLKHFKNAIRYNAPSDTFNPMSQMEPGCLTKGGIKTNQENMRFDTGVLSALETNPYNIPIADFPKKLSRYEKNGMYDDGRLKPDPMMGKYLDLLDSSS